MMNRNKYIHREIYFCKECGTLDYAKKICSKCGSINIVRANHDFMVNKTMKVKIQHTYTFML